MRFSIGLLSLFALIVSAQDTNVRTVKQAFDNANIPTDIEITFNPTALLEVTFPETGSNPITIHAGEQLPRNSTAGPPTFRVVGANSNGPFVVATVDPDAPTPQNPTSAEIRHFLGGNFRANAGGLLTNSTPAISNFLQPTPPAGSDAHRYIFLLFNQPAGFNQQTFVTSSTSTSLFNISAFAQEVGLGNPIAGTFMLVAPDPTTV
ncbi:PEBP-like protein [Macrolepiota fuliginosa MF-IS2]|uniref:PEBP-like protein n=1 Tax=Macrolepiota fuliginosa MF-IS2 TaxID=1400762 RepID=A0A9P6BZK9_9AGAR|nr:PEBP-like protein [Macrolepiota fuliginosa MF-IS2]